jgi:hypothetical protein
MRRALCRGLGLTITTDGADRVPRWSRHRVTGGVGLGRVRASGSRWAGVDPASLSAMNDAAVLGPLRGGAALTVYHCVSCSFVTGGDRRAGHARPAGLARLRDVINAWLEQTSFRAALTACAAALVLIGAAVAFALLVPGHGTAGGSGTVPGAIRSDLAGTAAPSAAAPASSPQPRAIAVPSASPATPDPAAPAPAASPAVSVMSPSPTAAASLPGCRHGHGHGRHPHC